MNPTILFNHHELKFLSIGMLAKSIRFYLMFISASFFILSSASHAQDVYEWEPKVVLDRIAGQNRLLPTTEVGGPISPEEQVNLANVIQFIPPELWNSSGIKVPFRKAPGAKDLCGEEASATLYLVEYISRTYGMVVLKDIPNGLYSSWIESPSESPITGRKQIPFFYFSDGERADQITNITPSKDLERGALAGLGLGDEGQGGTIADNGFTTGADGMGYWPMYLRGYLTSGGMVSYSTIPFGEVSKQERSQIPSQRFNYLDTESDIVVKIAYHSDERLHGWVPGDPGQFEVRFELHARDIADAIPAQAQKMRQRNFPQSRSKGVKWNISDLPPATVDDRYTANEGELLSVSALNGVLNNDSDPDNGPEPLEVKLMTTPCGGIVSCPTTGLLDELCPDGSFDYTPNPGTLTDSFTYWANDSSLDSRVATVTIDVVPTGGPIEFIGPINNGNNDAEEEPVSGAVNFRSSDIELVEDGTDQVAGLRFQGVGVPQGAIINSAYIQFTAKEASSRATNLTITGENTDNAPPFTDSAFNISSRIPTMASVSWSPLQWGVVGEKGPDQQTADIKTVLQEIVNRPGWQSGNDVAIIIQGTGNRVATSYDGNQQAAPVLHVIYE